MKRLKRTVAVIFVAVPLLFCDLCLATVISQTSCSGVLSPSDLKNFMSDSIPGYIREKGPLAGKFWDLIQAELMATKLKFGDHPAKRRFHQVGGRMGYLLNNEVVIASLHDEEFQVQVIPLPNSELAGFSDNLVNSFHLTGSAAPGGLRTEFQVANHVKPEGSKSLVMNYNFSTVHRTYASDPSEVIRKLDKFSFCFGRGVQEECYEVNLTSSETLVTDPTTKGLEKKNLVRVTRLSGLSAGVVNPATKAAAIVIPANSDSDLFLTFATLRWHSRTDKLPTLFVYLDNMNEEQTTELNSSSPLRDRFIEVAISLDALIKGQGNSILRHITKNDSALGAMLNIGALDIRFP